MRTYYLVRHEDVSGVSGPGRVAEVCVFSDGTVVLRWLGSRSSTAVYRSIGDVLSIHGHDGRTVLEPCDLMPMKQTDWGPVRGMP